MSNTSYYVIAGLFVGGFIAWFVKLELDRIKYSKAVTGSILCRFIALKGAYPLLLKREGSYVTNPKDNMLYMLHDSAIHNVLYPENKSKFSQVTVGEIIFYEGNPEPQMKADPSIIIATSKTWYAMLKEKFSEISLQMSREMTNDRAGTTGKLSPMLVYIMLGVIIIGVGAAVYFVSQQGQSIEMLKAAIGVK